MPIILNFSAGELITYWGKVFWASLTSADGAGIKIISDGSQHVRATVSLHSISVKILDYYGGAATGTIEWDGVYGLGEIIKTGSVVKGAVSMKLLGRSAGR